MAPPASSPQDPLGLLQSFLETENTNTAAVPKKADSRARSDTVSPLLPSATGILEESDLVVRTRNSRVREPEADNSTMSQMEVDADFPASSPEVGRAETRDSDAQMLHCSIRPRTLPGGDLSKGPPPQLLTLEEFDALEASSPHQPSVKHQLAWNTEPVLLPTRPSNPDAIPRFNHLCQVHSLTSSFSFEEPQKGVFSSKVRFGEYTCEAAGLFSNKRLAKEAVAESALEILESFQIPSKAEKGRPRKRTLTDHDASPSSDEADESWVAILHEFVQKHHHSPPQFQYTQHNTYREQKMGLATGSYQYSCTFTLDARPDYTFGSEIRHYPSKTEAKRLAARDAVIWLRTVGKLQDKADETSKKRRKSIPDEVQTGLTHQNPRVNTEQSPAQLVASLSLGLKLSPPQFDLEAVENSFYVCTARYLDQDVRKVPELEGSLCRTPRTYGQKSAKTLCCQDLAILLRSLVASRDETQ